jgi:predicted signal transduction protein with EAL and GGDEF domain
VAACEVAASAAAGHSRVSLSASVGVAHARLTSDTSTDDLLGTLNEAGTAMRAAKRSGRGRVVVFDAQLAGRYRRRRLIESRLLSQMGVVGGVYVHFQPLVELSSGRMVGVEALARWEDEVLGVVGPSEFVGVAEECGLIGELGERILREALAGAVSSGFVGGGECVDVAVAGAGVCGGGVGGVGGGGGGGVAVGGGGDGVGVCASG